MWSQNTIPCIESFIIFFVLLPWHFHLFNRCLFWEIENEDEGTCWWAILPSVLQALIDFVTSSFKDLISLTCIEIKSMKAVIRNLWVFVSHLVAGLPTGNYLHPQFFQFPKISSNLKKWKWRGIEHKIIRLPIGEFNFNEICDHRTNFRDCPL